MRLLPFIPVHSDGQAAAVMAALTFMVSVTRIWLIMLLLGVAHGFAEAVPAFGFWAVAVLWAVYAVLTAELELRMQPIDWGELD